MSKVRQFIKDCTRGCSNELGTVEFKDGLKVTSYHEWLTPDQALAAVEIAREELIEWLGENIDKYIYITGEFARCKMFEDFRNAMNE